MTKSEEAFSSAEAHQVMRGIGGEMGFQLRLEPALGFWDFIGEVCTRVVGCAANPSLWAGCPLGNGRVSQNKVTPGKDTEAKAF
jgi:hypothetical protein